MLNGSFGLVLGAYGLKKFKFVWVDKIINLILLNFD